MWESSYVKRKRVATHKTSGWCRRGCCCCSLQLLWNFLTKKMKMNRATITTTTQNKAEDNEEINGAAYTQKYYKNVLYSNLAQTENAQRDSATNSWRICAAFWIFCFALCFFCSLWNAIFLLLSVRLWNPIHKQCSPCLLCEWAVRFRLVANIHSDAKHQCTTAKQLTIQY